MEVTAEKHNHLTVSFRLIKSVTFVIRASAFLPLLHRLLIQPENSQLLSTFNVLISVLFKLEVRTFRHQLNFDSGSNTAISHSQCILMNLSSIHRGFYVEQEEQTVAMEFPVSCIPKIIRVCDRV